MNLLFPAFLIGLLGLALPWLLHRFSDQQPEELVFPTKQFLEPTTPPVSRKQRLKYRTLLALRILSLLLLCFLFAQPWLAQQSADTSARRHHMIVIDQSLSMRADGRWAATITHARAVLDELPESDSVELLGFDSSIHRIADSAESSQNIKEGLSNLKPGYAAADYGVVMQRLNRIAGEQSLPVSVWLITDQQKSALPAQLNALYAPQVEQLTIHSVALAQRNINLSAYAQTSDAVNVRLTVQLRASASRAASAQDSNAAADSEPQIQTSTVRVSFNQQVLAERTTLVGNGEIKTLVFDELVMPPGDNPLLEVRVLESDVLVEDNTVLLVIRQANPTPFALLNSETSTSVSAAVFVSTSLETDSLAKVAVFAGTAERVPPDTQHIVTGRDLGEPKIALDILRFVDTGSNALVFDSSAYTTQGAATVAGVDVGQVDESHPLALGEIDWYGTHFYDLPALHLLDNDRVLLETTDRQPLLVERPTARGRLLLLNDRLDGVSSNLPLQPSFVSLMQSIVKYFDASTALPEQVLVGDRLRLPGNVQLLDLDEQPLLALDTTGRSEGIELNQPGLYTVIGVRGEHTVSVVLDAHEADLSTVDMDVLDAWQSRYQDSANALSEAEAINVLSADSTQLSQDSDNSRIALWRWLLPLFVLAIFIESGVGNRHLNIRRDGS